MLVNIFDLVKTRNLSVYLFDSGAVTSILSLIRAIKVNLVCLKMCDVVILLQSIVIKYYIMMENTTIKKFLK